MSNHGFAARNYRISCFMKSSLGIGIIVAVALVASLCGEWIVAPLIGGSAVVPPMTALVSVIVMGALSFPASIGYAVAAGFLVDSVALPPFGATMALFIVLACAWEGIRALMADHKSYTAKIAMVAGLCVIAYGVAPWTRAAVTELTRIVSL